MVRSRYGCAFRCSVFFCEFVNGLGGRYPELFESDGVTSQYQANFGKKWRGYASLIELANSDIMKVNAVTKQPLEECLLFLAFKADKIFLENMLHKESLKKLG